MSRQFRVLHVCTGNIGRSPLAERIMAHHIEKRLGPRSEFQNTSAGTSGCAGLPMEPFSQVALERRGIDPGGFVARQLTDVCVEEADLVLTATRLHRAAVVGLVPAAVRRTFTLREFAALAGPTTAASPPSSPDVVADAIARVAVAGRLRGAASIAAVEAEKLDIADPIGARLGFYLDRAAEIDTACVLAVGLLLGRPGLDGPTD